MISKGSRLREAITASPDAFVYLACYLDKADPPPDEMPVWRALRGAERPLTYWAARQVLERANALLGTNWTLHDLRHTPSKSPRCHIQLGGGQVRMTHDCGSASPGAQMPPWAGWWPGRR